VPLPEPLLVFFSLSPCIFSLLTIAASDYYSSSRFFSTFDLISVLVEVGYYYLTVFLVWSFFGAGTSEAAESDARIPKPRL